MRLTRLVKLMIQGTALKRHAHLAQPYSLTQKHLIMPRLQVKEANLLIKVTV